MSYDINDELLEQKAFEVFYLWYLYEFELSDTDKNRACATRAWNRLRSMINKQPYKDMHYGICGLGVESSCFQCQMDAFYQRAKQLTGAGGEDTE